MASKRRAVVEKWDGNNRGQFEGPAWEVLAELMRILANADVDFRDLEFEYNSDGQYILTGIAR